MTDQNEREGGDDSPDYRSYFSSSFFEDNGATKARLKEERKRSKTPAQRDHAKKRPPMRTEFIGFRTTPEIAGAVKTLQIELGLNTTGVMERAIEALKRERGRT